MVSVTCYGCERSKALISIDYPGPDGPGTLCSACNKIYRSFRLPVFKLRNGGISARRLGGSIPVIVTGFERARNDSFKKGYFSSPVVRSATVMEHYALQRKRRVLATTVVLRLSCFLCSKTGSPRNIRFSGPDGTSTLCSLCHEKYLSLKLPLLKHSSGTISAKSAENTEAASIGMSQRQEHVRKAEDEAAASKRRKRNFVPGSLSRSLQVAAVRSTEHEGTLLSGKQNPTEPHITLASLDMKEKNKINASSKKKNFPLGRVSLRGFCVKATYHCGHNNEIRMILFPYGARFRFVKRALGKLFGIQTSFSLFYTDVDDEDIAVSSDIEMHPLFAQARLLKNSLRMQIRGSPPAWRCSR